MKIFIGSDHRGFALKEKLKAFLAPLGHAIIDAGNQAYDPKDDYPDYGKLVAQAVAREPRSRGIVICGSGAGICIAANRVRGVRAVHAHESSLAQVSRQDDDTNVLCLGADFLTWIQAKKVVTGWLKSPFVRASRRVARVKKLDRL